MDIRLADDGEWAVNGFPAGQRFSGSDGIRTELQFLFGAFSSREPVSASLENALIGRLDWRLSVVCGLSSAGADRPEQERRQMGMISRPLTSHHAAADLAVLQRDRSKAPESPPQPAAEVIDCDRRWSADLRVHDGVFRLLREPSRPRDSRGCSWPSPAVSTASSG